MGRASCYRGPTPHSQKAGVNLGTVYIAGKPVRWAYCPLCGMYGRLDVPHACKSEAPEQPHRCPVCEGRGCVSAGFYGLQVTAGDSTTSTESCRSCGGTGVVWRIGD